MTEPTVATKRQLRASATAFVIEKNAVDLSLRHGVDVVTVDMICEASGISQRTFFNYFPSKQSAVLGKFVPEIDEEKVRLFLASNNKDVVGEILGIIKLPTPASEHSELEFARIDLLRQNPELMAKQMERFSGVPRQMAEVIYLRFRRDAPPGESEQQTRALAELASELTAAAFKFSFAANSKSELFAGGPPSSSEVSGLLRNALERLVG